eukprot:4841121-Alexandrium_andersonii.AAC.1
MALCVGRLVGTEQVSQKPRHSLKTNEVATACLYGAYAKVSRRQQEWPGESQGTLGGMLSHRAE